MSVTGNDIDDENRKRQQTYHDFQKWNDPKIQAFQ